MSEGDRRIRIEEVSMGRQVYLLQEGVAGTESVVESFLIPSNPHAHAMVTPSQEMFVALVDRIEMLTTPPWDGFGDALKSHLRAGVGWVAKEVIR